MKRCSLKRTREPRNFPLGKDFLLAFLVFVLLFNLVALYINSEVQSSVSFEETQSFAINSMKIEWSAGLDPSGFSMYVIICLDEVTWRYYSLFRRIQVEIESVIYSEINSFAQRTYNLSVWPIGLAFNEKSHSISLHVMFIPAPVESLGNDTYLGDLRWRSLCINRTVECILSDGTTISWNLADTFNFSRLQTPLEQWTLKSTINEFAPLELQLVANEIKATITTQRFLNYSVDTIVFYFKPPIYGK